MPDDELAHVGQDGLDGLHEVDSDDEEMQHLDDQLRQPEQSNGAQNLDFYHMNQNVDMAAYEAYNEAAGCQLEQAAGQEEADEEARDLAVETGKGIDLDDDLNLLQQQIMSIGDHHFDYGLEDDRAAKDDYLGRSFDDEELAIQGQDLDQAEAEFEKQLQEQIRMDQLLMEKARFKQQINQISSDVGCHLRDAELVQDEELDFDDPMGYNGSD